MKHVKITLGAGLGYTSIEIDGVETLDVERFIMQQRGGDDRARLELTHKSIVVGELKHDVERVPESADIVIEGEAELVELFADEGRRADAEHRLALSSFVLHEHDEPELITLGECLRDARRYRALRYFADTKGEVAPEIWGRTATRGWDLDGTADELRPIVARELAKSSARPDTVN